MLRENLFPPTRQAGRRLRWLRWAAVLVVLGGGNGLAAMPAAQAPSVQLRFGDQTFVLRWSSAHQHEFTPAGQEDLARWTDMVTINLYPEVTDGQGLAEVANRVLATYQRNNARVLRTASIPRTADRPAEHLIVALFPVPDFIEAVFARFRMNDGIGSAVIVSHRIHGHQAGPAMASWLQANGPVVESQLMTLKQIPSARLLEPKRSQ